MVANYIFQLGSSLKSSRGACLPQSQAATAAEAPEGGEEGVLGRLSGWHEEATSHPPSSPSSSPREEAMQMEMRNKYSCLLCATADVFQNVWLGPQNQAHPAKEALSRRKRGDRVAYLSIRASAFWGAEHMARLWQPR